MLARLRSVWRECVTVETSCEESERITNERTSEWQRRGCTSERREAERSREEKEIHTGIH